MFRSAANTFDSEADIRMELLQRIKPVREFRKSILQFVLEPSAAYDGMTRKESSTQPSYGDIAVDLDFDLDLVLDLDRFFDRTSLDNLFLV
jgi:hypothetical protein